MLGKDAIIQNQCNILELVMRKNSHGRIRIKGTVPESVGLSPAMETLENGLLVVSVSVPGNCHTAFSLSAYKKSLRYTKISDTAFSAQCAPPSRPIPCICRIGFTVLCGWALQDIAGSYLPHMHLPVSDASMCMGTATNMTAFH